MNETITIDGQTIYPMDCLDAFPSIADKSIQLILTSPPYNLGGFHANTLKRSYAGYDDKIEENEYRRFIKTTIKQCHRVLKDDGSFFLNLKTRIVEGVSVPPYWIFEDNPFVFKQEVIWHFPSTANTDKVRFFPLFEYIFWFVKDKDDFLFNDEWAVVGNVWYISHVADRDETKVIVKGKEVKHPAPFPTQLAQTVVLSTTTEKEGKNAVLDPFLGSGTTLKVCRRYNRKGIGFEKYYDEYKEIVARRIRSNDFPQYTLLELFRRNEKRNARFVAGKQTSIGKFFSPSTKRD